MLLKVDTIRTALLGMIEESRPGDRLPSEDALARLLEVSRPTVRSALIAMEQEGLVARYHGRGTFVSAARPKLTASLQELYSVADIVEQNGYQATVRDVVKETLTLPGFVTEPLGIEDNTPGYRVTRTVYADGEPAVYLVDYLAREVRGIAVNLDGFSDRMIVALHRIGIDIAYAVAQVSIAHASETVAKALSVLASDAVLLVTQVAHTAFNDPVIYSLGYHREGYVSYSVLRDAVPGRMPD
jgi:GntR family transcriptional regulator